MPGKDLSQIQKNTFLNNKAGLNPGFHMIAVIDR
jgi:hypothetical protein